MPIFEYRCGACGSRFELLLIHSSPRPACPSCRSEDLEKLMSPAAVSSEGTQQRALQGARRRTEAMRYDRAYEDHKLQHDHDDH